MAKTGKTGADAVWIAVSAACRTVERYRNKLEAVVDAAKAAGSITAEQQTLIKDFIASINLLCAALEKVAAYSGL